MRSTLQDSVCLHSEEAGGGGRSGSSREEEDGEGRAIMG